MNLDGSNRQQVTTVPIAGISAADLSFCWSPDGTQLLYPSNDRLYAVRTDGTGLRMGNPVFSANGRQLLFSADSTNFQNEQGRQLDTRLYLLDLSSTTVKDLSRSVSSISGTAQTSKLVGTNDLEPRFSPTGGNLIFTNTDNTGLNQRTVYMADVDGSNRKVLLQQAEMPYWR